MAITNFQSEVWAKILLAGLKREAVYASPSVVNRNYEGEIESQGDTVRITSIGDPTIATYTKGTTVIDPEALTDAQQSLLINQAKYFAFEVDDVDKAQSAGPVMPEAIGRAARGLQNVADQYVAALYTGADAGNQLGTVSITSADLAYTGLVNLATALDEADVPEDGRYVIIPPWYHGLLLDNTKFVGAGTSGQVLRKGQIGEAAGFMVYKSNNSINVTGDDWSVMAGYKGAITFADQINKVEGYRPENAFSDAVKGLHLYGSKLIRPTGIATMVASKT